MRGTALQHVTTRIYDFFLQKQNARSFSRRHYFCVHSVAAGIRGDEHKTYTYADMKELSTKCLSLMGNCSCDKVDRVLGAYSATQRGCGRIAVVLLLLLFREYRVRRLLKTVIYFVYSGGSE